MSRAPLQLIGAPNQSVHPTSAAPTFALPARALPMRTRLKMPVLHTERVWSPKARVVGRWPKSRTASATKLHF